MNSEFDQPKPTIADEASLVVDDRDVIEKTLPAASIASGAIQREAYLDTLLDFVRTYVSRNPARAALVALGSGALLARFLVATLRRRP